jgi:limonene 1,2-monooxygenase
MKFGICSHGFRPHTTAQQTYAEDIGEIVLADELGFEVAFIAEHHGEPPSINKVDTIPTPELMMCKAAALTRRIRMGAAVKLIHLHHPLDVAIQAAVTDHLIGDNRFIFGFGSGFPLPLMCEERGLTYDDRHARLRESLDFILKAWDTDEPFDWAGRYWHGKGVIALPKPRVRPHMPIATATESEETVRLAGERGYTLISAFLEGADRLRPKADIYAAAARAAGRANPRQDITASRIVWVADSQAQAIEDMRDAVAYEVSVQDQRGFLKMLKQVFDLDVPNDRTAIEALVESGFYLVGEPDDVAAQIKDFWEASGGFGTFLTVCGKDWATREKRATSMRRFAEEVAPQLADLDPADLEDTGDAAA